MATHAHPSHPAYRVAEVPCNSTVQVPAAATALSRAVSVSDTAPLNIHPVRIARAVLSSSFSAVDRSSAPPDGPREMIPIASSQIAAIDVAAATVRRGRRRPQNVEACALWLSAFMLTSGKDVKRP
eukprot:1802013-Prymnesium_polylepis.1